MGDRSKPLLVLARDGSDPHLEEIRRECEDVKIAYCPSPLFLTFPAGCLDSLGRAVLLSDALLGGPASACASRIWPTSGWRDAMTGVAPPSADAPPTEPLEDPGRVPGNALFVALNETHVKMLHPVASGIRDRQFLVYNDEENALTYLESLGEKSVNLDIPNPKPPSFPLVNRILGKMLGPLKRRVRALLDRKPFSLDVFPRLERAPSVIVFGNDWNLYNKCLIEEAREHGVPTVCIQEGPLDFELESDPMTHADHLFLQGMAHAMVMPRRQFTVTGNPRLEGLRAGPLPDEPKVMVNANFTYRVFEEARDKWIRGVGEACREVGVDYFVSKHPRDRGSYDGHPVLESNAFRIEEQINMSSILITRFSTVTYESALRGRQVIYYNPHGEKKAILTEDRSGGLLHARTPVELAERLREALTPDAERETALEGFLTLHCGPQDGKVAERCVQAISAVARGLL